VLALLAVEAVTALAVLVAIFVLWSSIKLLPRTLLRTRLGLRLLAVATVVVSAATFFEAARFSDRRQGGEYAAFLECPVQPPGCCLLCSCSVCGEITIGSASVPICRLERLRWTGCSRRLMVEGAHKRSSTAIVRSLGRLRI
jgi:hypothetical protein